MALEKASCLMPEARLVVRSLYSHTADENYSITYITYPWAKDVFGVAQSKNHPDFMFQTPLYPELPKGPLRVGMEPKLDFQFIYDPTSDDCLLVNRSFGWQSFVSYKCLLRPSSEPIFVDRMLYSRACG